MAQLARFTKQREVTRAPNKGRYLKQRLHKRGHSTTTTPTLTSISPTSGTAAGSALTITLTGTNFVDGITKCQINLPSTASGGIDQSTTVLSATSATVSFPRLAIAGVYGFLVHNGEKYSTTVRTLTIT
jgi:hypothetical protein